MVCGVVCGSLWWFVVWFVVVCGSLWWFVVVCGGLWCLVPPKHTVGGIVFYKHAFLV